MFIRKQIELLSKQNNAPPNCLAFQHNRSLSEELTYIMAIFNTNWDFDVLGTSCYCLSPDLSFIPPNISPPFLPVSSPLFLSLLGVKEYQLVLFLFLALTDSLVPRGYSIAQ